MAVRRLDQLDYYALLKVERGASVDAIKEAFHAFARKYHPDQVAHDPEQAARHTRIYQRGTEAYRVLSHPEQRRVYDDGLAEGVLRFDPDRARSVGRSGTSAGHGATAARARPFAVKAQRALAAGDYRAARLHLRIALGHDPADPELLRLLAEVESRLDA